MGKGPAKVKQSPTDIATGKQISDIENQFSTPIRQMITPSVLQTLGGPGVFQTTLPSSDRDAIEKQFGQAQKQIQNNVPVRGGELNSQLADLQKQRAFSVSQATNQAKQLGINRALGLIPTALPNANATMDAAGGIAGRDQQRSAANAQMQNQQNQAKGQEAGKMASSLLMLAMS